MAISERLALLVTLDANGAVKSFNDLGKAADKNLAKADQRLDRMGSRFQKAGAGMLATAGLLGVGLYKAAQSASDLEQAVGGSAAVFGKASSIIDDYAKDAAQAAGLSESAFRQATTSIGGQLKALGFSTAEAAEQAVNLTQVAADLSATYGGTTAEAVAALGAAFRGEADPAERFNLRLNQTTVNAKAVELGLAASTSQVSAQAKAQATLALITEQSKDAQGQFAREADSAAGAMARFSAETENLKASVGQAVAPVLADVADGLSGIAEGFNNLSPAQQEAISKFALIGTGALGAAGALSFTIGKVIDARDRFKEFGGALRGAEGGLSKFGVVAGGITAGVGLLALAMYKAQQKSNDLKEASRELREEAERTGKTLSDVATQKLATTFAESNQVSDAMDRLGVSFEDLRSPLRGSQDAFDAWASSLRESAGENAVASEQASLLINRVAALRGELAAAEGDQGRTTEAVAELGIAMEGAAPQAENLTGAVDDQKDALDRASESLSLFKQGIEDAFGDLSIEEAADRRAEAFSDMAQRFNDAQQDVKDAKQRVADLQAIKPEDRTDSWASDLKAAQADVQEAIDATSRALEGNSEAALQNRDDIRGVVDDIGAIIEKHREEGASLEDLQIIRAMERDNLIRQLEQLGFNREEIQRYIDAIDAIPITKETTVTVDTATAEARLKEARENWQTYLDQNPLSIDVAQTEKFVAGRRTSTTGQVEGGRAIGGPVSAGSSYLVGEYRPEVFTPAVNGTIGPVGSSGVTSQVNNITINNPTQEPANTSIRKVRSELAAA